VYVDKKFNSISDYVNVILNNEISGLKVDEDRLKFLGTETIKLPFEIRDENDKITGRIGRSLYE